MPLFAAAFAVLTVASTRCSIARSATPSELPIRDVTILTMDDAAPRQGSVLVRGGRIEAIGATTSLRAAPDAQVIDGNGRFLISGLIDMHTHVSKTRGSSLSLRGFEAALRG